jgi:hypothetical protein
MKIVCCVLIGMLLTACASLPRVEPLDKSTSSNSLSYYQLPDTKIIIEIPVKTPINTKYRTCFSPDFVAARVDMANAAIDAAGVLSDNLYAIKGNKNPMVDVSFQVTYGKNYTINSSKTEVTNRTGEYVGAILKTGATVAQFAALFAAVQKAPEKNTVDCSPVNNIVHDFDNAKLECISGRAPGAQTDNLDVLKYRLQQIRDEKMSRLQQYTGNNTISIKYDIIPKESSVEKLIGYWRDSDGKFSKEERDLKPKELPRVDHNKGYPVVLKINRYSNDFSVKLWEKLKGEKGNDKNINRSLANPRINANSYYYRIAGQASVQIQFVGYHADEENKDGLTIGKIVPVAQYGIIAALPAESRGSTATTNISFNEDTGELKTLELGYKAISPSLIVDAATASADILKTVQDPEYIRLQHETAKRELEAKYKEATEELMNNN